MPRPVRVRLQDRQQQRDLQRHRGGARGPELLAQLLPFHDRLVEYRHRHGPGKAPLQVGKGLERDRVRIGREQDHRLDRPPTGLVDEADILDDPEELRERAVPEIDDLGNAVLDDQTIEQRHLAPDVGEVGAGRQAAVSRRIPGRIEIEGHRLAAVQAKEVGEEPRQEGLSDLRSRGGDDEDRCASPRRRLRRNRVSWPLLADGR